MDEILDTLLPLLLIGGAFLFKVVGKSFDTPKNDSAPKRRLNPQPFGQEEVFPSFEPDVTSDEFDTPVFEPAHPSYEVNPIDDPIPANDPESKPFFTDEPVMPQPKKKKKNKKKHHQPVVPVEEAPVHHREENKEPKQSERISMHTPNAARRAFIYSEIFNRKY